MSDPAGTSIILPTRGRPEYLATTLASVAPQAAAAGAQVLVVGDEDPRLDRVTGEARVGLITLPAPGGANAARNLGVARTTGALLVFIDDDIIAPDGWLAELLDAARAHPEADVLGGPIRARLEHPLRACGREPLPITTLDYGSLDREVPLVWSANMLIRRVALERVGAFDETIRGRGEEEDWQRRLLAQGGRVRYVAGAGILHRRSPEDSRIVPLSRANYALGRSARSYDVRKQVAPPLAGELRTLAGCVWHVARRRCAVGVVMAAHSAGRLRETLAPAPRPAGDPPPPRDDFLSGEAGQVIGKRAVSRAVLGDLVADTVATAQGLPWRLRHAARAMLRRRVLVLAVERPELPNLLSEARRELLRSRHAVTWEATAMEGRGKFENLNRLLARQDPAGFDWLLILDDDVALPRGFLDSFLFLAERFDLRIAQPAHRRRSHAAWEVTRRKPGAVARETGFVEIGPLCAFHCSTFPWLLPFPELRFGWGLDNHWSALAREHGWRIGVVDAVAIRHGLRQIAAGYDRADAIAEARGFLASRPYVTAPEAQRTLTVHRSWHGERSAVR